MTEIVSQQQSTAYVYPLSPAPGRPSGDQRQEIAAYLREVAADFAKAMADEATASAAWWVDDEDALHYDTLRRAADLLWPES